MDVISLSSDSSRPSSPLINISEVLNETEKRESCISNQEIVLSPSKNRFVHALSESDDSESELLGRDLNKIHTLDENSTIGRHKLSHEKEPLFSNELEKPNEHLTFSDKSNSESEVEYHIDKDCDIWTKYSKEPCNELLEKDLIGHLHNEDNLGTSSKYIPGESRSKTTYPKTKTKMTKEQRLEEKLKKQKEKELIRAEKRAAKELQNQMKPNNCMKFMTVILDSALISCPFSGTLMAAIQNSEAKYQICAQPVPLTVSWRREASGPNAKEENDVLLIWQWEFVIPAIKNHTLISKIQEVQAKHFGKSLFLIIYGLNGYFSYLKSNRRNLSGNPPKSKKGKSSSDNNEFPYVTKQVIEEELIELQITANCTHRLIECPEDLGSLVVQITKAIAETPFKLDKQKRVQENLEWFAVGDSRDCVAIDKAGNGLLRLWQQQLCQFNLAGHDVAQAIAAVYPGPLSLVRAYDNCNSQKECEDLLRDIQVRRSQGPLASSRRIGPELSKKIYTFFCSADGDAPLSQEQ
ncbi:crossover junction endonuclease EME1 isoform X1 [Homalodisca vitripennis]|uniref:crossover junction endonuclease EME1 isoform X1 n=2 Tax=Homalodisca vitripennis TaxID=197043 RepID=UPI001EEBCD3A|nr:crossover junction endonuclease EME1 isoform X1 [Homalodisca vitripennis]